jgi:hypothetical protein
MPSIFVRNTLLGLIVALGAASGASAQQTIGVTVNGQPVNLAPAPLERAGRVFVPLRGVFEHLGATVVYANGQINATRDRRQISLNVGSTQATVAGRPVVIDEAPFIIGASTYVPLRFVAQALGAEVNWDGSNQTVAVNMNMGGGPPMNPPPMAQTVTPVPQAPDRSPIQIANARPGNDASVRSNRPTIAVNFTGAHADPNSVHVMLDQLDITNDTSRSPGGIVYSPPSDLQPARHEVVIRGEDEQHRPFRMAWSFTSGSTPTQNFVNLMTPANGAAVGSTFRVRGKTLPGAHVMVEAGTRDRVGGFTFGSNTYRGDVTADANGDFATDVSLPESSGPVNLIVSSTDPENNGSAPPIRRELIEQR